MSSLTCAESLSWPEATFYSLLVLGAMVAIVLICWLGGQE